MPNRKAPKALRLRERQDARSMREGQGRLTGALKKKRLSASAGTADSAHGFMRDPAIGDSVFSSGTVGEGRSIPESAHAAEHGLQPALPATHWAAGALFLVLLWSWIKPIAILSGWTEPDKQWPLLLAVGVCVFLDTVGFPVWVGVVLKGLAAWAAVGWLFRSGGAQSGGFLSGWFREYGGLLGADIRAVVGGDAAAISGEHRTLIFLAGWMVLAGVVRALLLHSRRALWLLAITWLYLALLQLWPGTDTSGELMASGIAGLALLAVLNLDRVGTSGWPALVRSPRQVPSAGTPSASAAVAAAAGSTAGAVLDRRAGRPVPPWGYASAFAFLLVLFTVALAGAGSGSDRPVRPLETDRLNSWAHSLMAAWFDGGSDGGTMPAFAGGAGATGYSTGDYRLGGPLELRDEPVFTARSPVSAYWRGESKDYYDGSGWSNRAGNDGSGWVMEGNAAVTVVQELLYNGKQGVNLLFAGGAIRQVESLYAADGSQAPLSSLSKDEASGKYEFVFPGKQLGCARFTVRMNRFSDEELMQAAGVIPTDVAVAYLQLPDRLPERVKELALAVSAAGETPYAKAALLAAYLRDSYRYSLTEVTVPANGQDFVDAFLFGTKGGYCDYFSTSLAVMLRASGVPARWVKGFAPGDAAGGVDGEVQTFTVSTKDAHSWVELYVPGTGWVAMDPTPGFTGFVAGEGTAPALTAAGNSAAPSGPKAGVMAGLGMASGIFASWVESLRSLAGSVRETSGGWTRAALDAARKFGFAAALAAAATAPILYWFVRRRRLLGILLELRLGTRGQRGGKRAQKLLDRLWQRVFHLQGGPAKGQTLREYAAEVSRRWPDAADALAELTDLTEKMRFSPEGPLWLNRRKMERLSRIFFGRPSVPSGRAAPLHESAKPPLSE